MINARVRVPAPTNEPVLSYAPGSPERRSLIAKLDELASQRLEIPLIIGGRAVRTGNLGSCVLPHDQTADGLVGHLDPAVWRVDDERRSV